MKEFNHSQISSRPTDRFMKFHQLMRHRVRDILMISSLYDSFILGEEAGLYEMLFNEYMELNLSDPPEITRVSSGEEALELARELLKDQP